jgi:hypothetical protein
VADTLFKTILCADWSKAVKGREVYRATTGNATLSREAPPTGGWTVSSVIARALAHRPQGPVLVGFDAPIGVPTTYLRTATSQVEEWSDCQNFLDWLGATGKLSGCFEPASSILDWSVRRPFYGIPPKGRRSWEEHLKSVGIASRRTIDELTNANPVFVASGIPGSVGSAARDLWQGLDSLRTQSTRKIAVWPFEGSLEAVAPRDGVVVGEIYPKAAYVIALSPAPPALRKPLALQKSRCSVRRAAIETFRDAAWVGRHGVRIDDLDAALDSEDAFDALLSAAALLRCMLEGSALTRGDEDDHVAEGGILGCGSLHLTPRSRSLRTGRTAGESPMAVSCPIPGCGYLFSRGKLGWDGHVGSPRRHPNWLVTCRDPETRRARFREAYPSFFRP